MSIKPYQANTIANYFLDLAEESGESVSPMKLQKLIYFAHGWCLAIKDSPLIDEEIEAWQYGPVIESVYYEFREFGRNPIRRKTLSREKDRLVSDSFVVALLKKTWEVFGRFTAFKLSEMTHLPNSPWSQVVSKSLKTKPVISDEIIKTYFSNTFNQDSVKDEQCI